MALNQKYTWKDFLKENPQYTEKKIMRTSAEAAKAFETAFKKHIKEYLKGRLDRIEAQKKRASARHTELTKKIKALTKTKKWPRIQTLQKAIGQQDASLAHLGRQAERTKTLQKSF